MLTIPPYPCVLTESSSDVPLDQGWVVRPQMFFSCHLRPRGAQLPRRSNYTYCPDDIQVQLESYSTFEPMVLPMGGPMDAMGVLRAEAVRALTHAHSVCGPRRQCAGARALDAPLTPRQLACIFFSPTKFTFSPISSLFRQVGSLFRQVGSLFRQSLRSQVSSSTLESDCTSSSLPFSSAKFK